MSGRAVLKAKDIAPRVGTNYPAELAERVKLREKRALGDQFGLTQFGVNLTTLSPGSWSSHRHWHEREDEFVYVIAGELTLIDDAGEHVMRPGMCAGFKAGAANGHHLVNRSSEPATYIEVGTRSVEDRCTYSDIDMMAVKAAGKWGFMKKDGTGF